MQPPPAIQNTTCCWYAGLHLVAQLPLTVTERQALQREADRLLWKGALCVAAIPLLLIGSVLAGITGANRLAAASPFEIIFSCTFLCSLFCLPAMLGLWARDCFGHAYANRNDLLSGEKLRFEGCLKHFEDDDSLDASLRELLQRCLLIPDETLVQSVEVLTASARIWQVNGNRIREWLHAELTETVE
jgi:hypothetical protein